MVLEDAEHGVVHNELINGRWQMWLLVSCDECDLQASAWDKFDFNDFELKTWWPCSARDPASGVQADRWDLMWKNRFLFP